MILTSLCLIVFLVSTSFSATVDPVAAEIAKWKQFLEKHSSTSSNWKDIKESVEPLIQRAETASRAGQRNLALHVLAATQGNLAAQGYLDEHHVTAETKISELEEEKNRLSKTLESPETLKNLDQLPASVRAVTEATHSEIKVYYDTSVDYAKATMPEYGFFYLGLSQAQLDFTKFLQTLREPDSKKQQKFPGLAEQIDDLENKLLAEYKPPASIEQHPNFIRASALIKQAHELYHAGMEYGALYRILYARQIVSRITDAGKSIDPEEVSRRTKEYASQLNSKDVDHSVALIFLELANETPPNGENARAVFESILPMYFAAMKPPESQAKKESPSATVTLVRWPYT